MTLSLLLSSLSLFAYQPENAHTEMADNPDKENAEVVASPIEEHIECRQIVYFTFILCLCIAYYIIGRIVPVQYFRTKSVLYTYFKQRT